MKTPPALATVFALVSLIAACHAATPVALFDGRTFADWEGATNGVWRVRDGAIVGGSLEGNPRNEFLATRKNYRNFKLRLEYKLVGTEGFINGGVQFRSKRIARPTNEMSGFQADIGAGYSGCLYDESRRNRTLATADTNLVARLEKLGDWNAYEVQAEGRRIRLFLNGTLTVDYVEREPGIEEDGVIALQIHGNNKAEVSYRRLNLEVLPDALVPSEPEILGRLGEIKPANAGSGWPGEKFILDSNEVVVLAGQENFVREEKSGEFESLLAAGFAAGNPHFRPMPWEGDTVYEQWRDLNFGAWAGQLTAVGATMVIAQFGQTEALDGLARLPEFTAAYHRLLDQMAGGVRRLVLVSPIPFEHPLASHAPDLTLRNGEVGAYARAVAEVARQRGAIFVDLFTPLSQRAPGTPRQTDDGMHLNSSGLREVARLLADRLEVSAADSSTFAALRAAIVEKNRLWFDCWRPANWSFVYGDRVEQKFGTAGPDGASLREAFERSGALLKGADLRIQVLARGGVGAAPSAAPTLTPADPTVMTPEEEQSTFTLADGYEVRLFASERDGVIKPTQMSWDEHGRLLVACSPTYPQTHVGAPPGDYIIVLEDLNGDGRADRATRFAEGLTMVQGLEPGEGGLFVCDYDQLVHLRDTNGDGRADERRVVFSGFGVGDTHQLINSITHGPDGSLWFTQGLHAFSKVETPWGLARLERAGVWRLRPRTLRLDGFFNGGKAGHNCWGVAFDDFGQVFHKSGDRPDGYYSVPGLIRLDQPDEYHPVGPLFATTPKTTSIDIIGTRGLPDDVQGCAIIGGYFGSVVELHRFHDDGSGFKTTQLPKLMKSSTTSFRPVDVSVGPDGAIYVADWFNPVIGHYQASYADPKRDKTHGRIWRISAKGRAAIQRPKLAGLNPAGLLEQLRSGERWTRYQAKRLLFDAPSADVLVAADRWVAGLRTATVDDERLLLDVIGVFEAHEAVRPELLGKLLAARDPRVRAYGTRVIGAWADRLADPLALLRTQVHDTNARVRLESIVAGSYVPRAEAVEVVVESLETPRDKFIDYALAQSVRALQPWFRPALAAGTLKFGDHADQAAYVRRMAGAGPATLPPGRSTYEMACLPCHQPDGRGLVGAYPPLAGSDWVRGDKTRLIKIVLHGLSGPVTVAGQPFAMVNPVAMPALGGFNDEQIAEVLTYIRRDYGSGSTAVLASEVKVVREAVANRETPWTEAEFRP